MERPPRTRGRGTRLTLVALGIFALLAVVGFASRSGFGGSSGAAPSPRFTNYALSIFFVLFVAASPLLVWGFVLQANELDVERWSFQRRVVRNLVMLGLIGLVIVAIVYGKGLRPHLPRVQPPPAAHGAGKGKGARHVFEPAFQWPVLYVAVPLFLALAVAAVVLRRRWKAQLRGGPKPRAAGAAAELAEEIGDAIDDLEAEPDARRAVIAAYARMERALTRHGVARRPSETPFEYLARVLLDLRAPPDAVRRLTEAFERAKFSDHEIGPPAKREAIDALVAVRDGLHAASA